MAQPPEKASRLSRRDFLKLVAAAGTVLTFTPFIDWGKFLPNPLGAKADRAKVILPDGSHANVKTFPVNHSEAIIYPSTGDKVLDEEPFRRWQFIRLPEERGGANNDASAFSALSMVCLHLWCLWKYWPEESKKRGECPCHGSLYDAKSGLAIGGPAALQSPPSNLLPKLDLEVDTEGYLWIKPPSWSTNGNGIIGFGRFEKGINL